MSEDEFSDPKVLENFRKVKADLALGRQKCVKCGRLSDGRGHWAFDGYCPEHVPVGWEASR